MIFTVTNCDIRAAHGKTMEVDIDISAADVIEAFGQDAILDEIGENECIKHFDIEIQSKE